MKHIEYKLHRILHTNYKKSYMKAGQDWYIGNGQFLTLGATKKHLLKKMAYIKKALEKAYAVYSNFESMLNITETNGNLFADVLELEELLSVTELFVRDFIEAYEALESQEAEFREQHLSRIESSDELPF